MVVNITRFHLRRASRDLAQVYRDLASEMNAAASKLEKAERPFLDTFPAVNPLTLSHAIQRAAVLHYVLDALQLEKGK